VSEQALKLTSYFGERSRVEGRLLADKLLDLHGCHAIQSSILLRGIQGFGAKHQMHSDRLLTLSEDLPLVSVALDSRKRIQALWEDMSALEGMGLTTLEPTLLGGPELHPGELPESPGEAVKLTVYLGRHERANDTPAFAVACQALYDSGVAGATVLLGVDGTVRGQRRRARFFARNANVPLMVMSMGEPNRIASALPRLATLPGTPLLTLERVRICKRDGVLLQAPQDRLPANLHDEVHLLPGAQPHQKLTIVISEATRHEHRSVYVELVKRLRETNAAGATSLRGIWGFHGDHHPHGDRLLSIRRHVPVVTEVIDIPERIATLFPIVDELTREHGLVTSETLPGAWAQHTPLVYS
jgi:PII-like signaling protein